MRPRSWRRTKASRQFEFSGERLAPVMATRRPPSASRARADEMCRSAASATRSLTWAATEKGGFINTTVGRTAGSRWSWMWAASCRVTPTHGNRRSRRDARVSANSLSTKLAPANSAWIARSPVPAEGSSTRSAGVIAAAAHATKPRPIGVENCWSAWLSSERRVCDGSSPASLASIARNADGDAARSRMAGPNLRRNRTCAASQAS